MNIPIEQVRDAILFLIALILSISVHEFGHAWMANRLGDMLPKSQGRLTLSPLRHIDPVGTIVFPLIIFFTNAPLLGWGRPVETNPLNYTRRFSPSTGHMLVAIAGPAMNLALALLVSAVILVGASTGLLSRGTAEALVTKLVSLNLVLMFFNLLPIPPLDGGAVLAWVLPRSLQHLVDFLARWGFLILIGLMLTGYLGFIMGPAYALVDLWGDTVLELAGL